MERWLDGSAAAFAFIAAFFWFLSAYGKVPPMVPYFDYTPESDPFLQAVRFSAHMNTLAALSSGFSAGLLCVRTGLSALSRGE